MREDLIGKKINNFTITEVLPSKKYGNYSYKMVKVLCVCGAVKEYVYKDLKKEKVKSCGCLNKTEINVGDVYNEWTVIDKAESYYYKNKKSSRKVACKCSCGTLRNVSVSSLKNSKSKSCGCLNKKSDNKKKKFLPESDVNETWIPYLNSKIYMVSSKGRVYDKAKQKFIETFEDKKIKILGKLRNKKQLIAESFIKQDYKKDYIVLYENNTIHKRKI
jgi:hypothetical protein